MSHYFITDDSLAHQVFEIEYYFGSLHLLFRSDNGIFSKDRIDAASDLLLRNLPPLSGSLLDLGCGYGLIGISLAKKYGLNATLSDVNERALGYAAQNADANQVKARIIHSDRFLSIDGHFDTIALNPPIHAGKTVIYDLYQGAYDHLMEDGHFYIVIQKKHGAQSSQKKLLAIFGNCSTLYYKKGYYLFDCQKRAL